MPFDHEQSREMYWLLLNQLQAGFHQYRTDLFTIAIARIILLAAVWIGLFLLRGFDSTIVLPGALTLGILVYVEIALVFFKLRKARVVMEEGSKLIRRD